MSAPAHSTRLGYLLGPHGVVGGVKLYVLGDPAQVSGLKRVYVEGRGWLALRRSEPLAPGLVLHLAGVGSREAAEELRGLKANDRPAVIRAIAEAREHGDLSENAEYHAAREKQSFIEGRIKELEMILSRAEVIDPSKLSGSVKFGARVTVVDEDTDEQKTFQLVGEQEADLERGLLNVRSPLARALIGKDEGDSVEVVTPGGQKSYEILSIRYE